MSYINSDYKKIVGERNYYEKNNKVICLIISFSLILTTSIVCSAATTVKDNRDILREVANRHAGKLASKDSINISEIQKVFAKDKMQKAFEKANKMDFIIVDQGPNYTYCENVLI